MGTLMAVGIMILPATAARFWARSIDRMVLISAAFAALSIYAGLIVSYHVDVPSGPAIILATGVIYLLSMAFGPIGSLLYLKKPAWHYRS